MMMLKDVTHILHVNDTAAQASMIRYYLRHSYSRQTIVATVRGDPFHISDPYQFSGSEVPSHPRLSGIRSYDWHMWWQSRKADIVHTHSIISNRPRRMFIMRRVLSGRTFIIHYHGSDMRMATPDARRWFEENAAAVLCSTPDLMADDMNHVVKPTLIHTMVNPEPFEGARAQQNNRGLCCLKGNQTVGQTLDVLEDNGYGDVSWQFVRRPYTKLMPDDGHPLVRRELHHHTEMPGWLSGYEYYADISADGDRWMDARSIIGVEAAIAGCKVIDMHGKIHGKEIVEDHLPTNVAPKVKAIYDRILEEYS